MAASPGCSLAQLLLAVFNSHAAGWLQLGCLISVCFVWFWVVPAPTSYAISIRVVRSLDCVLGHYVLRAVFGCKLYSLAMYKTCDCEA